jgi:hypothetical protein
MYVGQGKLGQPKAGYRSLEGRVWVGISIYGRRPLTGGVCVAENCWSEIFAAGRSTHSGAGFQPRAFENQPEVFKKSISPSSNIAASAWSPSP